MSQDGRWEWAGGLPKSVIDEARAELSEEEAVADALLSDADYGPLVERLAKEKMCRGVTGEQGAARRHILGVLMQALGVGGNLRADAESVLNSAKIENGDLDWVLEMREVPASDDS